MRRGTVILLLAVLIGSCTFAAVVMCRWLDSSTREIDSWIRAKNDIGWDQWEKVSDQHVLGCT